MRLEDFKEFGDILLDEADLNEYACSRGNISRVILQQFIHLISEYQEQHKFQVRVVIFL